MKLSREEKRIKIAEACEWKEINRSHFKTILSGIPPKDYPHSNRFEIPNYFNDLNAMHGAEALLSPSQLLDYEDWLASVLKVGDAGCDWKESSLYRFQMIRATAAQRAEAFGLTLNLWTPDS